MSIYDNLTELDKSMITRYIELYSDGRKDIDEETLKHILRYWAGEKEHIYHIFGNNFIVEKEISYKKDYDDLYSDIHKILYEDSDIEFRDKFRNAINKINDDFKNMDHTWHYQDTFRKLISTETLVKNKYDFATSAIIINEKIVKVQTGTKPMHILKKIFHVYGYDDIFEQFRIKHSMALNENIFKGTMCLSIHPLDYMTMSDNNCNWQSCMNWRDQGSYRRGTVEMMNSPMAIVAYLKSSTPMKFDEYEWNSKRWREIILYNQNEFICGVKGYPMWNRSLEKIAVDWVKELVTHINWGVTDYIFPWEDPTDYAPSEYKDKYRIYFEPDSYAMYNDFNEEEGHQGCFNLDILSESDKNEFYFNYSGRAVCMNCGKVDFTDSDCCQEELCCEDCSYATICDGCGDRIYDGDIFYVDGETLCEDCYYNNTAVDDFTGETHFDDNLTSIAVWNRKMNTFHHHPLSTYNDVDTIIKNIKETFGEEVHLYKRIKHYDSFWNYDIEQYCIDINELNELGMEQLLGMNGYCSIHDVDKYKNEFISFSDNNATIEIIKVDQ